MIQAVYKGIEIEMEMHQLTHGYWKCDFTLIKHPVIRNFPPWTWPKNSRCKKRATQSIIRSRGRRERREVAPPASLVISPAPRNRAARFRPSSSGGRGPELQVLL
jgi:hypothetical protein